MKYIIKVFHFKKSLNFLQFLTTKLILVEAFDKIYQEMYPDGQKKPDRSDLVFARLIEQNKFFGLWFALRELDMEGFGENIETDMNMWQTYKENHPELAKNFIREAEVQLEAIDCQAISLHQILDSSCVMKFPYLEGISPENYREELELYYVKSKKKYFFHYEYYDTFEHAYFALQHIVYSWRNIYYVLGLLDLGLPTELTADEYWDAIDNSPAIQQTIADKIAELKEIEIKNYGKLVAIER